MGKSNRDRIREGLDLLKEGLYPFMARELKDKLDEDIDISNEDTYGLLKLLNEMWMQVFDATLGKVERSYANELRDIRNRWAHEKTFNNDDTIRALDTIERLLTSISAKEADTVRELKAELNQLNFEEKSRAESKRIIESVVRQSASGLPSWRTVISPHPDVRSGKFNQAEFAADLDQVFKGKGSAEYKNPIDFFARTYITKSLREILMNSIQRLTCTGGDPVIQLQTNFGGGKTHTMLALYHLYSGTDLTDLEGVADILNELGVKKLPAVKRVVFVGTKISPHQPPVKDDGTAVKTMWGEIAYQLGGKEAYDLIRSDDEKATNPGDKLRTMFDKYGPCIILIDEWVAYARQLHDAPDLGGGSFETHFTFAQALTEAARASKNCLLVISIPASDDVKKSKSYDDVELGGTKGREALERLRTAVGRVETSWRPASSEESFEIVRRRLFEPVADDESIQKRDYVAKAFVQYYKKNSSDFPKECQDSDYEKRIKSSYPIHPQVFHFLYNDWSTRIRFQRTRGVLRLMALVIHSLWSSSDTSPLILPAMIPLYDNRVSTELLRNLEESESWSPIISKDIDGEQSLPVKLDKEYEQLGKYSATRRIARTLFMGTAPTTESANRGIIDTEIMLGSVLPGEPAVHFRDGLRKLSMDATYLYQESSKYWYQPQPNINRTADDLANDFLQNKTESIIGEIERCVKENVKKKGDFLYVYTFPAGSEGVQDTPAAGLVILSTEYPYTKDDNSEARQFSAKILAMQGKKPREFQNVLAFLAADKARINDLNKAVSEYLAWNYILERKDEYNLDPSKTKQAVSRKESSAINVQNRIRETYIYVIVPGQDKPGPTIEWQTFKVSNGDLLAERASARLIKEEHLLIKFPPSALKKQLDSVPLWRGDDKDRVSVKQLIEDFAKCHYLYRLKSSDVLIQSIKDNFSEKLLNEDTFAYADGYDEKKNRFIGLKLPSGSSSVSIIESGIVVKHSVAREQCDREELAAQQFQPKQMASTGTAANPNANVTTDILPIESAEYKPKHKRYFGSVKINTNDFSREVSDILKNVITHLKSQEESDLNITLEISAVVPYETPDHIIRTVKENSRSLKFNQYDFEDE